MDDRVASRLVVPVVAAALAGGLAWAAGLDAGHVLLVVIAVLLVGGVVRVLGPTSALSWADPPEDASGTGCHLVALQARVLHEAEADRERYERLLAPRLRRLATARLHAAGRPASARTVHDELGRKLFEALRPGRVPRRRAAVVAQLLDRLDQLDPPPTDRPPAFPATAQRRREDTTG